MFEFDPTKLDWTTGLLAGWTYDKPIDKWFQGAFRKVHRLTRTCPTCTGPIVLDVTQKALEGRAKNHGLALRRCKECRRTLKYAPQEYAERKIVGTAVAPVVIVEGSEELEAARATIQTMKEETAGLYEQIAELRTRLAKYELPEAMRVSQNKLPWN